MEASAIPASAGLARTRIALGAPLLRIRSDEQLVSLFRAGSEDAFRVIHDRYRNRMFAYARQMLAGSSVDPEDAVQEVFVRAYRGLRANDRQLALRAWLYRIAHNRCIDELRRPQATASEQISPSVPNHGASDPVARLEQRDALRRLIADVQRLPDQQRSALLMRELAGMSYADVSGALGVSVPAVKSLLVRARVGLAQADAARDTACARIRADLIVAHDRGVRASGLARRHLRDCPDCRRFRSEVRGVSHELAGLVPALGPIGVVAKLLGFGGSGGAAAGGTLTGGGAAAGGTLAGGGATAGGTLAGGGATAGGTLAGGGAAATGVASTATAASAGAIASAGHVVTILAAAVVTAGGAIELQHIAPSVVPHSHPHAMVAAPLQPRAKPVATAGVANTLPASSAKSGRHVASGERSHATSGQTNVAAPLSIKRMLALVAKGVSIKVPLTELVDPDHLSYLNPAGTAAGRAGSARLGSAGGAATAGANAGAACAGALAASGTGIVTGTGLGGAGSSTPAGTGSSGTGSTGSGYAGSGSTGSGSADSGYAGAGSAGSGYAGTGSTGAGSTGAGSTVGGTGAGAGATGSTSTGANGACTGSPGSGTGATGSGTGATGSGTGGSGSSAGATGSGAGATGSGTGGTGSGSGSSGAGTTSSGSADYAPTASNSGADGGPARATSDGTSSRSSGTQSGTTGTRSGGASTATRDSTTASDGGAGSTSATGSRSQTGRTGAVAVFTVTAN